VKIGSLFSGYGGLEQGVQSVFGGGTAWVSDIDPGACKILAHRYPDVPNLGDITRVDWMAVEPVDVLTGGFPCQDVSHAGKRAGLKPDTRSGLWSQMAYAIDTLRPRLVVAENVRGLLSAPAHSDVEQCPWCVGGAADGEPPLRALGAVLGDLADLGYDARWVGLRAADVGAPHGRFRVFVVAQPADSDGAGLEDRRPGGRGPQQPEPVIDRVVDADTNGLGHEWSGGSRGRWDGPADHGLAAADAASVDVGDTAAADTDRDGLASVGRVDTLGRDPDRRSSPHIAWGDYEPAIRRWEHILGRPAPAPTEPGKTGARLSPRFVEFMMGLPDGWVTDVPGLSRNDMLRALGNGVVPQQAAAALRVALGRADLTLLTLPTPTERTA